MAAKPGPNISDRPGSAQAASRARSAWPPRRRSPAASGRWSSIQKEGGLYRSDDMGETWEQVSDNQNLLSRAWYYIHLTADPHDPDTVYVNNLDLLEVDRRRQDLRRDPHAAWRQPRSVDRPDEQPAHDPGQRRRRQCLVQRRRDMVSTIYNQPTAQFYHIATDNARAYIVYGTQQDNTSVAVPSRSQRTRRSPGAIATSPAPARAATSPCARTIPTSCMSARSAARPAAATACSATTTRTGQIRLITTWPEDTRGYGASEHKYRFAWTYPIVISPHDPNTLYIGGNMVFKSDQRRPELGADQPRPDPRRPRDAPANRRTGQPRLDRRRDLRHRLCLRRIAARAGRFLGRLGRWADAHLAATTARPGTTSRRPTCPNGP